MRIESDSLGTKAVDDAAYYGIHTERARENFPVTSRPVNGKLVRNLILVKEACAPAACRLHRRTGCHPGRDQRTGGPCSRERVCVRSGRQPAGAAAPGRCRAKNGQPVHAHDLHG